MNHKFELRWAAGRCLVILQSTMKLNFKDWYFLLNYLEIFHALVYTTSGTNNVMFTYVSSSSQTAGIVEFKPALRA